MLALSLFLSYKITEKRFATTDTIDTSVVDNTVPYITAEQSEFVDGTYRFNKYYEVTQGVSTVDLTVFQRLMLCIQDNFEYVGYDTTGLEMNIVATSIDDDTTDYTVTVDNWVCVGRVVEDVTSIRDFYKTSEPTLDEEANVSNNMRDFSLVKEDNVWRLKYNANE